MTDGSFGLSLELAGGEGGGDGAGASSAGGDGGAAGAAGGGAGGEAGGGQPGGGSAAAADGASGAGGAGAAGQPSLKDEDLVEVVIDGKTEKVPYKELKSGYSRQSDYTRKTQQHADERRRWESDRETLLRVEREKWQREEKEAAERQRQESETDPAQRALSSTQRLEQRFEDQALDIAINRLSSKFDGFTERQFLIEASSRGITSAEGLAKHGEAILAEMVKTREEGFNSRFGEVLKKGDHPELAKYREAQIAAYLAEKKLGPTPPNAAGGATPSLSGAPKKARTLDEAADMADEMLKAGARA